MLTAGEMEQLTSGAAVDAAGATAAPQSPAKTAKRRSVWRREEADTLRRRALAEGVDMGFETNDGGIGCTGARLCSLEFKEMPCLPVLASGELKGILITIIGLNEHKWRICSICEATNLLQLWRISDGLHRSRW
ncbi:hypothetical protein PTKIN_Ptkin10aG0045300 [Pterospermum kingtungense]